MLRSCENMIRHWTYKGSEYRQRKGSFTIRLSSHALERIEKRKGQLVAFKDATYAISDLFAQNMQIDEYNEGDRLAIRSEEEGIIIILTIEKKYSETDWVLCICTVWNNDLGTFYFRRGMKIYDFMLTNEGVMFTEADEETVQWQDKYVFEK